MLTESEVRRAIEMECEDNPILSVSLNVDPHRRSPEKYRLALRVLLDKANDNGADPKDIKRMQDYLDLEYDRTGRGVVMYSCAAEDFWWVHSFLPPVEDSVNVGRRTSVRELAKLMDTYERYGVIHVEQVGARLFSFHLGQLEDATGYLGEDIKVDNPMSERRVDKQEAEKARQNLQAAADLAERFYSNNATKRLILAGTEKNVASFRELLVPKLRKMVVGRIGVDANAGPAEIREKAINLAREAANNQAQVEADSVITLSHKGGAVTGLTETLTAVQHGRAQHIVALADFSHPAYRFVDSGVVMLELTEDSELVSGKVQKLPDAVDSVLRRAMVQGIGVTILDKHQQLEAAGQIGALTRY